MSVIHFSLNEIQDQELEVLMKKEGITTRAGFFRFLIKFYKYHQTPQQTMLPEQNKNAPSEHQPISDAKLSPRKQKLLNDPRIFDEGVRELIRNMKD